MYCYIIQPPIYITSNKVIFNFTFIIKVSCVLYCYLCFSYVLLIPFLFAHAGILYVFHKQQSIDVIT